MTRRFIFSYRIDPTHPLRQRWGLAGCYAWEELIHLASWRNHNELKRGQLLASVSYLQGLWDWSRGRVVRFLDWLERNEMIARDTQTGRKWTRITILQYETYQRPRNATDTRPETANETASETSRPPKPRMAQGFSPPLEKVEVQNESSRRRGKRKKACQRETWLTPYYDAWVERFSGKPSGGSLAKHLKSLHDEHGLEKLLPAWRACLAETDPQYAQPGAVAARFAATVGSWIEKAQSVKEERFCGL